MLLSQTTAAGCSLALWAFALQGPSPCLGLAQDPGEAPDTTLESTAPDRAPAALYLTWQRDPTRTMTVHWHGRAEDGAMRVEYAAAEGDTWTPQAPHTREIPGVDALVHTAELSGLEPGSEYRFRIAWDEDGARSEIRRFHTMPAQLERPLRIAIGGDVMHRREWMERTNREALARRPDFVVWGGDMAYADGRADRFGRWEEFFRAYTESLIDAEGRVVPVVVAIGNHEVLGGYYWGQERGREGYRDTDDFREGIAPYFYSLFAFPGHPGFGALDFGDYLSLLLLDSDHSGPVEGRQTEWLAAALAERDQVPHVLPIYHVPAYPSVRSFGGGVSRRVREHWVPLFERHGLPLAFEHHDHAYKRTAAIRGGELDPEGVVYLGDGAWGVDAREVHAAEETWYLERSLSVRHFFLAELSTEGIAIEAIDEHGETIDQLTVRARGAAAVPR